MSAPDFGPKPQLFWLPTASITVDDTYQRSLESVRSRRLIGRIIAGFRWSAFQAILAAPSAPDHWHVIDGQHRLEAARQLAIALVPAIVIEGTGVAEEAGAFLRANHDRVTVSPFALHRALIAAEDPEALAIDALCRRDGIVIPRRPAVLAAQKPGETLALGTLRQIMRSEPTLAERAVLLVAEAYRSEAGGLRGPIFRAVFDILHDATPESRPDTNRRLAAMLGSMTASAVMSGASRRYGAQTPAAVRGFLGERVRSVAAARFISEDAARRAVGGR